MKKFILRTALLSAIVFVASICVSAQTDESSRVRKVVGGTAKVGVVVVGSAAKYSWKATKFTAKHVAKPIVVKAVPAVGKFALKQTGRVVKRSVPVVKKFAITYLKFRLSP
jgi:hypothetical protein